MSDLACTIVLYRPDPNMLATKFRYWHVEELLDQANTLINRCLKDFKDYSALNYAWHQFLLDLESEEKKLGIYRQTRDQDVFDRDVVTPQKEEVTSLESQESQEESEILTLGEPVEVDETMKEPEAPVIKSNLDLRAEAVQRKKELSAPGQPFAVNERRDLALNRLCRDYEEAVNRCCVAEEGLKQLYDHVGASSPLPSEAETLGTSISNLAMWIRNSIEWLVGYHQLEQRFTRVVSIRSLLNRNAWTLLKHSRDSYSIKLPFPADLFRGHDNCHMRGIGASLIGEAGTVPWSMVLRLPEEAVYERSGQSVEVDQTRRASCLLGRVENRRSVRPMEICGGSSLLNASPIGRSNQGGMWSVEIFKPLGATSETFSHVEDVVLEINVVGIPQKIAG